MNIKNEGLKWNIGGENNIQSTEGGLKENFASEKR